MNSIREDLKAFVDGELSEARMEEVRAAIDSDPALQQEVEELRLLGFEIKKLASEPAVVGKERVLDKVRRPKAHWWDASRLSGRLAYAGALFICLAGVSAILFPVFAQPKFAAKRSMAEVASKMPMNDSLDADAAARSESELSGESMNGRPSFRGGGAGNEKSLMAQPPGSEEFRSPADSGMLEGQVYTAEETPAEAADAPGRKTELGSTAQKDAAKSRVSARSRPSTAKTPAPETLPAAPPTNRMVVKNSDITLKVDDAKRALEDATDLAKKLGGYAEGGNLTAMEGQTPQASCVLRVKSDLYETAMKALRGMGEVLSESSNAQDVTAQHADTVGRLSVLRAEADSYVTMLRGAKRIGEIMEIKDRLSQVRQEIASLEAQRKALSNESALSTIRATFRQKESIEDNKDDKKSGFDETWAKAQNGLSNVGEFLGNLAIYGFVFAPVWLPPVLLFWWLTKRAKA